MLLNMLEHQKMVLRGVSFNIKLFKKELIKSFSWLNDLEKKQLVDWCMEQFPEEHRNVVDNVFCTKYNFAC